MGAGWITCCYTSPYYSGDDGVLPLNSDLVSHIEVQKTTTK